MTDHDPSTVDNLLLEWTIMLLLQQRQHWQQASSGLGRDREREKEFRIFPVYVGALDELTDSREAFDSKSLDSLTGAKEEASVC